MILIGISGKIGSGKSTVASYIGDWFETKKKMKARGAAFADALKAGVASMTKTDLTLYYTQEGKNTHVPEWGKTIGEILQDIGNHCREKFGEKVWIDTLIETLDNSADVWVISDVRYPNELEAIKSKGGIIIRTEGDPSSVRANSSRDMSHPSECSLDGYEFDFVIQNNSTLDNLSLKIDRILTNLFS